MERGLRENAITWRKNSLGGKLGAIILKTLTPRTKGNSQFIMGHERFFISKKLLKSELNSVFGTQMDDGAFI